jgi:polysaccharide biosynthesis transport protein
MDERQRLPRPGTPGATVGQRLSILRGAESSPADTVLGEQGLLMALRRRKWAIVLPLLVVPAVAVLFSLQQDRRYEAQAKVLLSRQNLAASLTGTQDPNIFLGVEGADRVARTLAEMARTPELARRVLEAARVTTLSPQELLDESSVTVDENRDLLRFTVRSGSESLASTLATTYAREFLEYRSAVETAAIRRVRASVQRRIAALVRAGDRQSSLYNALVNKDEQLATLQALGTSNAFLVSQASTANQVAPRPVRNGILGVGFGLFLGIVLAFLWDMVDTRVRSDDEIASTLHLPLLGRLPPPPRRLRAKDQLVMAADPGSAQAEAFRLLRTNLAFVNLDVGAKTIMFTSAEPGEGKSTTAANLALALAKEGRRVIVVDLDVRRPFLARFFDLENRVGLTDAALGLVPLASAVARVPAGDTRHPSGSEDGQHVLGVLPLGAQPPNPAEFVGNRAVATLLQNLREMADIVVIDAPPLLHVGDAMILSGRVDAIIAVTRIGTLRRPALRELNRALQLAPAAKLGFVVTGSDAEMTSSYYGRYRIPQSAAADGRRPWGFLRRRVGGGRAPGR